MKAVFVTGTDTHVGKSLVSAWLCRVWQADYWKPVQSGLSEGTDTEAIQNLSPHSVCHPETHRLSQPLSPHLSAQRDGVEIDLSDFSLPNTERLVVEGAGGLLVPLNAELTIADLIKHLSLPCLIVARSTLGTINHTCLTLEACRHRGLNVLGVITTGPDNPDNLQAIEHFGNTRVLAHLPELKTVDAENLEQQSPPLELLRALNGATF